MASLFAKRDMEAGYASPRCSVPNEMWLNGPFVDPINPNVACLVAELLIRGVPTSMSGDTDGMIRDVVYVDLRDDEVDTLEASSNDLEQLGWSVGLNNIQFLAGLVGARIPDPPQEFKFICCRIARKGKAVGPSEARAVASVIAAHRTFIKTH